MLAKVAVYRKTLPWRASGAVVVAVLLGSALGATLMLAGILIPVMAACTLLGRTINRELGERWYSVLFWSVMGGYIVRLVA